MLDRSGFQWIMKYDPRKHHRRSIRLRGYDYTRAGGYFITICAYHRACLFGEVVAGEMRLNHLGRVVDTVWRGLPGHFTNLELDEFVVMPDHFHGILVLTDNPGRGEAFDPKSLVSPIVSQSNASPLQYPNGTRSRSVGAIVQNFKSVTTRRINQIRKTPGTHVWQRDYHDRIIRDETAWLRIRAYIQRNPAKW